MSRTGCDEVVNGTVRNGFDYSLQVWVKDFIVYDCGHPEAMKTRGCCEAHRLAGQDIRNITGRDRRPRDGFEIYG